MEARCTGSNLRKSFYYNCYYVDSAKKDDVSKEIRVIRCLEKATETTMFGLRFGCFNDEFKLYTIFTNQFKATYLLLLAKNKRDKSKIKFTS